MSQAAGWFHDPYGRFEQRYWDGTAWTEHVSTGGAQSVDPLGDTTVIPFAIPASAVPTAKQPQHFLDSLGADARNRPAPRLSLALAGGGGALVAIGIVAAIFGDSLSRGSAIVAAAIILAGALAVRLVVKGQPDLKSAAVGAGVVGILTLGTAIVADDVSRGWAAFIVGVLFLAAWLLPGFRGRPLMLGIGTLLMVAALGSATASNGAGDGGVLGDVPFSNAVGDQNVVFLLAAAVLLGLVWWLDRHGYFGVGTPLVVVALVSAFVGVAQATSNLDDAGAAILIFAVGLGVCFVGSHGDRRATTWWGALLASIGVVAFFASIMTPDSVRSTAGMFLISGALLIVGPAVVRAIRASQNNGTMHTPPSTANTPGTSGTSGTLPPPSA